MPYLLLSSAERVNNLQVNRINLFSSPHHSQIKGGLMSKSFLLGILTVILLGVALFAHPITKEYFALQWSNSLPLLAQRARHQPPSEWTNLRWTIDEVPLLEKVNWHQVKEKIRQQSRDDLMRAIVDLMAEQGTLVPPQLPQDSRLSRNPVYLTAWIESQIPPLGQPNAEQADRILTATRQARQLDSDNAFFDLIESAVFWTTHRPEEGVKRLREALKKKRYEPYSRAIAEILFHSAQTVGLSPVRSALYTRNVLQNLPHHVLLRRMSFEVDKKALALESTGQVAQGIRLRYALLQVGSLLRQKEPLLTGVTNGVGIILGSASLPTPEEFLSRLRQAGLRREAEWAQSEINTATLWRARISGYVREGEDWLIPLTRAGYLWYLQTATLPEIGLTLLLSILGFILSLQWVKNKAPLPLRGLGGFLSLWVIKGVVVVLPALKLVGGAGKTLLEVKIGSDQFLCLASITPGLTLLIMGVASLIPLGRGREDSGNWWERWIVLCRDIAPWCSAVLLIGFFYLSLRIHNELSLATRLLWEGMTTGEIQRMLK